MINKIQAACPKCAEARTRVVLTKRAKDGITIRRRCCITCEHRWYSIQYPEVAVEDSEVKWIKTGSNATFVPSA